MQLSVLIRSRKEILQNPENLGIVMPKLHYLDLLWICRTVVSTTNP